MSIYSSIQRGCTENSIWAETEWLSEPSCNELWDSGRSSVLPRLEAVVLFHSEFINSDFLSLFLSNSWSFWSPSSDVPPPPAQTHRHKHKVWCSGIIKHDQYGSLLRKFFRIWHRGTGEEGLKTGGVGGGGVLEERDRVPGSSIEEKIWEKEERSAAHGKLKKKTNVEFSRKFSLFVDFWLLREGAWGTDPAVTFHIVC